MTSTLEQMLAPYETGTLRGRKNAMKEVMQEIVLCGLSRAGFFERAAFYGGTALRIFYGLDRFSEDLDFSLTTPDEDYSLAEHFPVLESEVRSFGLRVDIREKIKTKDSAIRSAFLKGNTREYLLLFYPDQGIEAAVPGDELVKIKFEIDTNPPAGARCERKYRLLPAPYEIRLCDAPSLFAGKVHAVLCRGWKSRVKGRDLYDYVFYRSRRTPLNLEHLNMRLRQSGFLQDGVELNGLGLRDALCQRFEAIDFGDATRDVEPFIEDAGQLRLWSADFFKQITEGLSVV